MNLYEILGVDKKATADEIKKSYRRLAMKYHPDRNTEDPDTTEKFTELQKAYEILSDHTKRQEYDRFGNIPPHTPRQNGPSPTNSQNINDVFENIRKHFVYGGFSNNEPQHKAVSIPVTTFVTGGNITVRFRELVPNVGIRLNQSEVKISPDSVLGGKFTITDQSGKEHTIVFKPVDTPNLKVVGNINLLLLMEFNALELASSEHITVQHPNGKKFKLHLGYRQINPGTKLRIPNNGLRASDGRRGDFFVEIRLFLPPFSPEQKKNLAKILKEK